MSANGEMTQSVAAQSTTDTPTKDTPTKDAPTAAEFTKTGPVKKEKRTARSFLDVLITDRMWLLAGLIVVLIVATTIADAAGVLVAPFTVRYLSVSLIALVPLALLALAETFVILSGRSGIDLSVGGLVSISGMFFGSLVVDRSMSVVLAAIITLVFATVLGALNGYLVGFLGFPPLIATLATGYAFSSIALVVHDGAPYSDPTLTTLNGLTSGMGPGVLAIPWHVVTVLLPVGVLAWMALSKMRWGRAQYAVGTSDSAARYSAINQKLTRASAYAVAGLLSGIAALVNVAQFASARPDAGTAGNGLALPAITIAVLGGVAIAGGVGKIGGALMAALFVTWMNAIILITFPGSFGSRVQLLALGLVLIGAVLLNQVAAKRRAP